MIKKSALYFVLLLFISTTGHTQKIMHSVGSTASVMWANLNNLGSVVLTHSEVTYFPRVSFLESGNTSVSIGVPLSAGISLIEDEYTGESKFFWGYDIQGVVDFNFGAGAVKDNDKKYGGYIGAGFSYNPTSWEYDPYFGNKAKSYGPLGRAGARFGFPKAKLGITIGTYFKVGMENEKFKTIGFNLLLDF